MISDWLISGVDFSVNVMLSSGPVMERNTLACVRRVSARNVMLGRNESTWLK